MHEMWCGPDVSGQAAWHVLTTDKTGTLCGAKRLQEPNSREPTDKHCFTCMSALQAVLRRPTEGSTPTAE